VSRHHLLNNFQICKNPSEDEIMLLTIKRILFALILIAILIVSNPESALANSQPLSDSVASQVNSSDNKKCWPLDIVLLIDQSGSMMGIKGNNDPDNYRFDAVRETLDQIVRNKQDQCIDAVHRIALVTFGEEGKTYLYLSPISLRQDDDPTEWEKTYLDVIKQAESSRPESYTDFRDAFKETQRVFERATKMDDPKEYGSRRQVVIFITDGKPTANQGTEPQEAHMCELKSELDQPFWKEKSIWIVALNADEPFLDEDGCSGGSIRQDLQDIALAHNGQLKDLPYNEQFIPTVLGDIVSAEFGQTSEKMSCDEVFYIDPYLQQVKLRFYRTKNDEMVRVKISKLDDSTLEPIFTLQNGSVVEQNGDLGNMSFAQENYRPLGFKEEYVIDNPLPGAWIFNVEGWNADDCQRKIEPRKIDILAEVFFEPNGILPQVSTPPYYETKNPIFFSVTLRNNVSLQPLLSNPGFPLEITLNWKLPSGSSTLPDGSPINPILLHAGENGKWQNSESPILTPEVGLYTLEIIGTAPSGNGKDKIKIFSETRTFDAKPLTRFDFTIDSPANDIQSCNQITDDEKSINKPVDVQVQLRDNLGNPVVRPDEYITGLENVFQAELVDSSGTVIDKGPLTYTSNGIFSGTLLDSLSEINACEKMVLRVKFTGSYDETRYALLGEEKDKAFERVEAKGIRVDVISPAPSISRFDSMLYSCSDEDVSPVLIQLRLTDLAGQEINPNNVLAKGMTNLFSAYITGPFSERSEKIDLIITKTNKGYILSGSGGAEIQDEGEYSLEVVPNVEAFARGYTWAHQTITYQFTRQDGMFTNPTACKSSRIGLGVLSAIFLGLIVFAVTGGPGGSIQFMDDRGDLLKKWGLSLMRLMSFRKYSSPALNDKGIKYVQFSRGAIGRDTRAVHIKIVDNGGDVIWDSELQANLALPVTPDVTVQYYHAKHKDTYDLV